MSARATDIGADRFELYVAEVTAARGGPRSADHRYDVVASAVGDPLTTLTINDIAPTNPVDPEIDAELLPVGEPVLMIRRRSDGAVRFYPPLTLMSSEDCP